MIVKFVKTTTVHYKNCTLISLWDHNSSEKTRSKSSRKRKLKRGVQVKIIIIIINSFWKKFSLAKLRCVPSWCSRVGLSRKKWLTVKGYNHEMRFFVRELNSKQRTCAYSAGNEIKMWRGAVLAAGGKVRILPRLGCNFKFWTRFR